MRHVTNDEQHHGQLLQAATPENRRGDAAAVLRRRRNLDACVCLPTRPLDSARPRQVSFGPLDQNRSLDAKGDRIPDGVRRRCYLLPGHLRRSIFLCGCRRPADLAIGVVTIEQAAIESGLNPQTHSVAPSPKTISEQFVSCSKSR